MFFDKLRTPDSNQKQIPQQNLTLTLIKHHKLIFFPNFITGHVFNNGYLEEVPMA